MQQIVNNNKFSQNSVLEPIKYNRKLTGTSLIVQKGKNQLSANDLRLLDAGLLIKSKIKKDNSELKVFFSLEKIVKNLDNIKENLNNFQKTMNSWSISLVEDIKKYLKASSSLLEFTLTDMLQLVNMGYFNQKYFDLYFKKINTIISFFKDIGNSLKINLVGILTCDKNKLKVSRSMICTIRRAFMKTLSKLDKKD